MKKPTPKPEKETNEQAIVAYPPRFDIASAKIALEYIPFVKEKP